MLQSCVDLVKSSVYHYMRGLSQFIRTNKIIRDRLKELPQNQQWHTLLNKTVSTFVDSTYCERVPHTALAIGVGSSRYVPRLLSFDCVQNKCDKCGIEKKLLFSMCTVLIECELKIHVLEWIYAPRSGTRKDGTQNTQLALGQRRHKVSVIVQKLLVQLQLCRLHTGELQWKFYAHSRALVIRLANLWRHISTDFGASLGLRAAEYHLRSMLITEVILYLVAKFDQPITFYDFFCRNCFYF